MKNPSRSQRVFYLLFGFPVMAYGLWRLQSEVAIATGPLWAKVVLGLCIALWLVHGWRTLRAVISDKDAGQRN